MGTLMGLHEIDKFSKIRSIYLTRKIINNTTTPPTLFAGGWTHLLTYLLTYKPRGASPHRDYEDGISMNRLI